MPHTTNRIITRLPRQVGRQLEIYELGTVAVADVFAKKINKKTLIFANVHEPCIYTGKVIWRKCSVAARLAALNALA